MDGQEDPVSGEISSQGLLVAFLAIVAEAVAARLLELAVADQLLISGCRAFIQLSCLGVILHPIFSASNPGIVLGYIFGFMVMVSAYEAAARPKVTYPGIFRNAVISLGGSLLMAGVVLLFIVAPSPWYNAQYLIPLAGMLINNSLSGVALALNEMIDHLTTQKEYVSVLLAFGATPWEAAWPGFVRSAQKALIPAINGMNVIGLVSIPGMMTGQILGGASPVKAARYQIVITFLISACTFMSVGFICLLTIRDCFDGEGRHDTACMVKQSRLKIAQWSLPPSIRRRLLAPFRCLLAPSAPSQSAAAAPAAGAGAAASKKLLDGDAESGHAGRPLKLVPQRDSSDGGQEEAAASPHLLLDLDLEGLVAGARPLAARLRLRRGEVAVVMGPSGIGKSTLLKWICNLQPADRSKMSLSATASGSLCAQSWRRDVLYVHQSKAPLPGEPQELLRAVARMRVNRGRSEPDAGRFMRALGLSEALLERPWSELSGGEAQRAMLAIALSTQPACLLLDEPTSALDEDSKRLVEAALRDAPGLSVLLVTHDEQQAARINGSLWRVVER